MYFYGLSASFSRVLLRQAYLFPSWEACGMTTRCNRGALLLAFRAYCVRRGTGASRFFSAKDIRFINVRLPPSHFLRRFCPFCDNSAVPPPAELVYYTSNHCSRTGTLGHCHFPQGTLTYFIFFFPHRTPPSAPFCTYWPKHPLRDSTGPFGFNLSCAGWAEIADSFVLDVAGTVTSDERCRRI